MLEYQTADSILATIRMQEPQPRIVLLVEGPDDDAVLEEHLATNALGIVCGSRTTVVDSVNMAQATGWRYVLGLIDRDLAPETNSGEALPEAVVTTHAYDLTADIAAAKPGVIGRAASSHAHREARRVSQRRGEPLELSIIDLATRFAGVRIAVAEGDYPVVLKGFDFRKVIDTSFVTQGADSFADNLVIRDPNFVFTVHHRQLIAAKIAQTVGHRYLAGGHDLAAAAFGLLTKAGARRINKDSIERAIRSHADCGLLRELPCIDELQKLAKDRLVAPLFDCYGCTSE